MTRNERAAVEALLWAAGALAAHVRVNMDEAGDAADTERRMLEEYTAARGAVMKVAGL